MGSSMFSYLMGYEDPRLSAYFLPVDSKSTQGKEAFDGKQYQQFLQDIYMERMMNIRCFLNLTYKQLHQLTGYVLPKSTSCELKLL